MRAAFLIMVAGRLYVIDAHVEIRREVLGYDRSRRALAKADANSGEAPKTVRNQFSHFYEVEKVHNIYALDATRGVNQILQ